MKPRTNAIYAVLGGLVVGCAGLLGFACGGGGDNGGPIIVPMNDASGNQTGSGGSTGAGGSAETGGGSTGGAGGDVDAADEGNASSPEGGGTGGTISTEAGGCITSPVTFEDYLNACPDPRVLGCLTFTTPLPDPLPPLP